MFFSQFGPHLRNPPDSGFIPERLLHLDVPPPEPVNPRQDRDGAFKHVPGVVDEPVLHLELGVLEPEPVVPVIDLERSLPDGPYAPEVLLRLLPPRVPDVDTRVPSRQPDLILKLLALARAVVGDLRRVGDRPRRSPHGQPLRPVELTRLVDDLLGGDLDRGWVLVLDLDRTWK